MLKPKKKRTYKELFIDKLRELSNNEPRLVNNKTLMTGLDWDAERYQRIKNGLIAENAIISGHGGPGGAVSLTTAPGTKLSALPQVFISYSHVDEKIKTELTKHLMPLKRLELIDDWHDRKIEPGDKWETVISDNLKKADIVILIVSIDFINSKYCYDVEMEEAIDRAAAEETVIIPVIARSCMWKSMRFSPYQALPTDGKAIELWSNIDEALTNVADGIRLVAEKILGKR